jgi:transcriptional regulator with AAA-type ATPase domain/transcriptional regulatory protein LevR
MNNNGLKIKRNEKIYKAVRQMSRSAFCSKDNKKNIDFKENVIDTNRIAQYTGIDRSNVSRELNSLVKNGEIIKVNGKPVLYFDKESLEEIFHFSFQEHLIFENYEDFIKFINNDKNQISTHQSGNTKNEIEMNSSDHNSNDTFSLIIGTDKSLKRQVELAKAAILYPPNGLHTIITGPTGVGKSTFAEVMYRFAIEMKRIPPNAAFVLFNCADYANNAQLLLSHLFGYVKGAFTGADKEKTGLIDQADSGILFLDEVHRLPPEGQEMISLLIDKGVFNRLGETSGNHPVKVLIIAATTENLQSSMLKTFLRRIPVIIDIPDLNSRSIQERVELIATLFKGEAIRINKPITVSKDVLTALTYYNCSGNIGQLKSDIQLLCAKAFLDKISFKSEAVCVKEAHILNHIKEEITTVLSSSETDKNLFRSDMVFYPHSSGINSSTTELSNRLKYEIDYYEKIVENWNKYSKQGLTQEEVFKKVESELKLYFKDFYSKINKEENRKDEIIINLVGAGLFSAVKNAIESAQKLFKTSVNKDIVYGLSIHINNLFKRIDSGLTFPKVNNQTVQRDYSTEYAMACHILKEIEEQLNMTIPESEATVIAMLLYAMANIKQMQNIGVLVMAHGDTTASSMLNVARKLLHIIGNEALDMSLDAKIDTILDEAIEAVKRLDQGKGVLLLTDMGALTRFASLISEKTGFNVLSVNNITTATVLEAVRKSIIPEMTLERLAFELNQYTAGQPELLLTELDSVTGPTLKYINAYMPVLLGKMLIFFDSTKAYNALKVCLDQILKDIGREIDKSLLVKFMFHSACMLERQLRNIPLKNRNTDNINKVRGDIMRCLQEAFQFVEESFSINICDSELTYIIEILDTHYGTCVKPVKYFTK